MEKSLYNERFSFADPISKTAACRSTRFRAKKLKEDLYSTEALHNCTSEIEEPAEESSNQIMLEPQNILLSSPPLLPTSSYTDKANSEGIEFEDLQYSCHPQSIEFSELLMTAPER